MYLVNFSIFFDKCLHLHLFIKRNSIVYFKLCNNLPTQHTSSKGHPIDIRTSEENPSDVVTSMQRCPLDEVCCVGINFLYKNKYYILRARPTSSQAFRIIFIPLILISNLWSHKHGLSCTSNINISSNTCELSSEELSG